MSDHGQACRPQKLFKLPRGQSLSSMTLQFYWYQHPLQSSQQKSHLDKALLIRFLLFYDPLGDSIEGYLSLLEYNGAQMLRDWELIFS